jgi:hypothetical protein
MKILKLPVIKICYMIFMTEITSGGNFFIGGESANLHPFSTVSQAIEIFVSQIFAFPFANHSWLDLTPILLITRGRVMLVLPANNAHADRLPKLAGYGAQKACGG